MTEIHKALAENFPLNPYVFCDENQTFSNIFPSVEDWNKAGSPFIWKKVESKNGYDVWIDLGYGYLALTKGEILIATDMYRIVGIEGHEHVAVLEKTYYGTKGYLFFGDS